MLIVVEQFKWRGQRGHIGLSNRSSLGNGSRLGAEGGSVMGNTISLGRVDVEVSW